MRNDRPTGGGQWTLILLTSGLMLYLLTEPSPWPDVERLRTAIGLSSSVGLVLGAVLGVFG